MIFIFSSRYYFISLRAAPRLRMRAASPISAETISLSLLPGRLHDATIYLYARAFWRQLILIWCADERVCPHCRGAIFVSKHRQSFLARCAFRRYTLLPPHFWFTPSMNGQPDAGYMRAYPIWAFRAAKHDIHIRIIAHLYRCNTLKRCAMVYFHFLAIIAMPAGRISAFLIGEFRLFIMMRQLYRHGGTTRHLRVTPHDYFEDTPRSAFWNMTPALRDSVYRQAADLDIIWQDIFICQFRIGGVLTRGFLSLAMLTRQTRTARATVYEKWFSAAPPLDSFI